MQKPLCVIAGVGPGIGIAVARRFATENYAVALIGRNQDTLDDFVDLLHGDGHEAHGFAGDLGNQSQVLNVFERILEWNNNVQVLIYNAARLVPDDVMTISADDISETMQVNFFGAVSCVNASLPSMQSVGSGTILLTGGGLALEPYPNWTALAIGKAALRSYGISLYKALIKENIKVCVIAICGIVEPGGPFDPDIIANEYWALHAERTKSEWKRELIFQPEGTDAEYNDPDRQ